VEITGNNNNNNNNVYGAVCMAIAIARVYPVHANSAPVGCRISEEANRHGLSSTATIAVY